jgi:hypothetical protein
MKAIDLIGVRNTLLFYFIVCIIYLFEVGLFMMVYYREYKDTRIMLSEPNREL